LCIGLRINRQVSSTATLFNLIRPTRLLLQAIVHFCSSYTVILTYYRYLGHRYLVSLLLCFVMALSG